MLFGEKPYTWYCNLMLMLCYATGELGHFLLGVTSKPMAQSIHFGDQGCMPQNFSFSEFASSCSNRSNKIESEKECSQISSNGTQVCKWDYTGSGVDYQLLAGPYFVAIFTVMGVVLGVLGDRYNRVRILSTCVLICSVTVLLTGFSNEYWQLAVLRLGFGGAEAGFSPLSASIIADMFSKTSRGLGMSIFNWGIYFGFGSAFAVGNLVTGANINSEGWRWAYYISGVPGFLMAAIVLFSIKEPARKNISVNKTNAEVEENLVKHIEAKPEYAIIVMLKKIAVAIKIYATHISLLILLLGACIRHSASFCFAYNAQLYFNEYYPLTNLGLWMTLSSIVGGTIGIASGGLISDLIVSKYGVNTRLWVLVFSQGLATPLAVGVLYLKPPYCFFSLIGAYLFAEMWFGVLFAVLVEILPTHVRSTCLATFFFVINNVAGLVLLGVPGLKHAFGTRLALTLVYPGFYLASSLFFMLAQIFLKREFGNKRHDAEVKNEDEASSE